MAADPGSEAPWRRLQGTKAHIVPNTTPPSDAVSAFQERDDLFTRWMTSIGAAVAVVRPDRYVFGTAASRSELNALLGRLSHMLQA